MATDGDNTQTLGQRFRNLVHRWNRRGIVEIGPENVKLFELTRNIRKGLRLLHANNEMTDESLSKKIFIPNHGSKICSLQALQPKTFQELRREHNLTNETFLSSIAPSDPSLGYLQFLSSSKSGQLFVFCNDKRYIIKTEKKKDAKYFMKILPTYVEHLQRHPHSLLVRYMGFYCLNQKGRKPIYFSVMKNVFYPDGRIIERYDLKGCHSNRYVKLSQKSNPVGLVLKDQNFNRQQINLGPQKQWFDRQISIDTDFMQMIGVMDYSLLLGKQPLLQCDRVLDERLADVVARLQKSVKKKEENEEIKECCNDKIVTLNQSSELQQNANSADKDISQTVEHTVPSPCLQLPGIVEDCVDENIYKMGYGVASPGLHPSGTVKNSVDKDMAETIEHGAITNTSEVQPCESNRSYNQENLRLLVNLENSLHILDGVDDRYFLGIIDFFTTYGPKKKLEFVIKSLLHPFSSFSAVSVFKYANRFKNYLSNKSV